MGKKSSGWRVIWDTRSRPCRKSIRQGRGAEVQHTPIARICRSEAGLGGSLLRVSDLKAGQRFWFAVVAGDDGCDRGVIEIGLHGGELYVGGGGHLGCGLFAGDGLDEREDGGNRSGDGLNGGKGALPAGGIEDS